MRQRKDVLSWQSPARLHSGAVLRQILLACWPFHVRWDGTHIRLADANPVRCLIHIVVVHIFLLCIKDVNGDDVIDKLFIRCITILHKHIQIVQISADISKLLPNRSPDTISGWLLGFCKRKVFFPSR